MATPTVEEQAAEQEELLALVRQLQEIAAEKLAGKIVTVVGGKGGIGKTFLAIELAWLLMAVLVDLDWEDGNASKALGHDHERYVRIPLMDALETGKTPRPRRNTHRPDLVPCHPDFALNQPESERMKIALIRWSQQWGRPVLVDTHPGVCDSAYGAEGAADLLVIPVVLGTRELRGLNKTLNDLVGYRILLIPNWIPGVPPAAPRRWLREIAEHHQVAVGPMVSTYGWMKNRLTRTAITAGPGYSRRTMPMVRELSAVAEAVIKHAA